MADPSTQSNLVAIGTTALKQSGGIVREEFHPNLKGRKAAQTFIEMRDNDATIGAIDYAITSLVRKVSWTETAADDSPKALEARDHLYQCRMDLSCTWEDLVAEIFSKLVFGWSYFERVYKLRQGDSEDPTRKSKYSDGKIGIRKIELRAQESLDHWEFDADGGLRGMWQTNDRGTVLIPIERSLLFRTTAHKNNPEGRSLLRNAYRSWYYLKRLQDIEGVGHERNLAGLPVLEVPPEILDPNATGTAASIRSDLEKLVQEIRTDSRMGLVLPSASDREGKPTGYKFSLVATGGRDLGSIGTSIERYQRAIAATVNANFIEIGTNGGSYALDRNKTSFFALTLHALLDSVTAVLNRYMVRDLMILNGYPPEVWPKLDHGDITQSSLADVATYLGSLAGFIQPKAELEDELLRRADLPVPVREEEMPEEGPLAQTIGVGGTQAMVEIVSQAHNHVIPAESAINMIVTLFGLPLDQAASIVGEVSNEVAPEVRNNADPQA